MKGLADFWKFNNLSTFFHENSAENYPSDLLKNEKDASRWDLNLSRQNFSSKINSSAGMFEKPKKCQK